MTSQRRRRARAVADRSSHGFAMVDVIIAVSVITTGLLVTGALLLRSASRYREAAEFRRVSTRAAELADSLLSGRSIASGATSSREGRVLWSPIGGTIRLQAWGRDTASVQPLLELWFSP